MAHPSPLSTSLHVNESKHAGSFILGSLANRQVAAAGAQYQLAAEHPFCE
jgi:hypothetical protein